MEHLITKYLEGGLTLDEQHELSKWLQSDEKNVKTLNQIEVYWRNHKEIVKDEELEVRSRLHRMIEAEAITTLKRENLSRKIFYRIAASVALLITSGLGLYGYLSMFHTESNPVAITLIEKVSLPGQKITTILPDGTTVKLNSNSKLIAPAVFDGKTREVTLIGEAFFDVRKNPEQPFIVKTKNLKTTVLGTSFNVSAYSDNQETLITLLEGKVNVMKLNSETSSAADQIILIPGEQASFDLSSGGFSKRDVDLPQYLAWKDGILLFKREPLSKVFLRLSNWYGIEFDVLDEVLNANCQLDGEFNNESLETVLISLSVVYGFEYEFKEKNMVTIRGETNCN